MLGTLLFSSRDQRYSSQQKSSYRAGAQLDIYSNRPGGKERAKRHFYIPSSPQGGESHFCESTRVVKCKIAPHGLQCPIIMLHTDWTQFIYNNMVANRVDSSFECLHESGSGLSSYIRAPGSACIMRCSNAFTQLSMLLKKIQHT